MIKSFTVIATLLWASVDARLHAVNKCKIEESELHSSLPPIEEKGFSLVLDGDEVSRNVPFPLASFQKNSFELKSTHSDTSSFKAFLIRVAAKNVQFSTFDDDAKVSESCVEKDVSGLIHTNLAEKSLVKGSIQVTDDEARTLTIEVTLQSGDTWYFSSYELLVVDDATWMDESSATTVADAKRDLQFNPNATIDIPDSVDDVFTAIEQLSYPEMYRIFRTANVDNGIPDGNGYGIPFFIEEARGSLNRLARLVWRGKQFQADEFSLSNNLLFLQYATATCFIAPGREDGLDSIVLDYSESNMIVARPVWDEIREVPGFAGMDNGVYVGRAYYGSVFVLYFWLVFV